MGCSYEIKENLPAVIRDKQTGRHLMFLSVSVVIKSRK